MFERIKNMFSGSRPTAAEEVGRALGVDPAVGHDMENAIALWSDLYADEAPWLFGEDPPLKSLNLPASIAGEFARLATLELASSITGSPRADFLNAQYQRVLPELRRHVEYGCAKGGLVFKPYVAGRGLAVDYVQADCFFPTAFDSSGRLMGAAFVDRITSGRKVYTRLEHHSLQHGSCIITNFAFGCDVYSKQTGILGEPVSLEAVPEWAGLKGETRIQGVDRLLIGYFRVPFANAVDTHSPLGVSVYSRAVDLIRQADEQYSRILWEYEGSELAIDADEDALSVHDGRLAPPKRDQRLFRKLGIAGREGDFYSVFSPAIRDASLFNGLNNILRRIEFQCALAYGTLSDPQNEDKTAEEIKFSRQRSYSAVSDLQKALQKALDDMIHAMDVLTGLYRLAPPGEYETAYKWDDSIVVDANTERMQDKEDVRDGIMHKWEFRVKWYGEDEATAKRMAPDDGMDDDEVMGFGAL